MITNPLLFLKLGTKHKIERINVTIAPGIVNQAKNQRKTIEIGSTIMIPTIDKTAPTITNGFGFWFIFFPFYFFRYLKQQNT
ncbi:Hypothetical protein MLC_3150 [Mycoplasma mycoides subsp. capri LC str. 95010]|uniref:Uncharacterized protein n=1 Tax=Mycoplasma mycoides subsp. capri LC str. 95010 TaxID=862259 RepID=F4MPL1_MYCML|nr:Hypothetical protein MLC_3150 [Mycoplasma mycoides subsp. capri LC str. 95010]